MTLSTIEDVITLEVPTIKDYRGNLAVLENGTLPFDFKRVYYIFDIPSNAYRGGHAHLSLKQFIISLSGSFDVVLDDGTNRVSRTLNKPNQGLLLPPGIWRELENFSSGAVCLVLASDVYSESDYIRDYDKFKSFKGT